MKVISEEVVLEPCEWPGLGKCLRQKDELGQRSCGGHTLDLIEDSKKAVEVAVKGRVVPGEMRERLAGSGQVKNQYQCKRYG